MMSTVGLELTSFVNPDLTWKTVSKGNRSGMRRTRKPCAKSLTVGMGLADKNARTLEDVTVSESEKLGVDVLGRRFSEKVENVPIKKRRFMFRSPSPPPPLTPCPHLEASGQHVNFQSDLGQNFGSSAPHLRQLMKSDCFAKSSVASIDDEKISEVINGVEDFSGIEILAAAACSDSIGNDVTEYEGNPLVEESTQERIESSASAMHLEETTASLETACYSPKDSVNESKTEGSSFQDNSFTVLHESPSDKERIESSASAMHLEETTASLETACYCLKDSVNESKTEGSSFQDNSFAVLHESPSDKDNTTAERSIPLPDDRLLWDLNLSMDAWPCDGGIVDSQKDAFDHISVRSEELQTKEPQDIKNDTTNKVVSTDVDGGNRMTSDLRTKPVGTDDLSREKQESVGCSGSSENKTEHVTVPVVEAENSVMSTSVDTNVSIESVSMDQCLSHSPFSGSDKGTWVSEEDQETSMSTHNVELNSVGCISEAEIGKTVCVEGVQVEECDVASPCVPVLATVANDIQNIQNTSAEKDDKDHDGDSGLHDVKGFAHNPDNPPPLESPEVEHTNGAEEMDICHFSPKSEDMSISDDYVMEAMERTDGASSAYTAQVDSVANVGSEVLLQKSSRNSDASSGVSEFSTHEACRIYVNGPTSYLNKANLNDTPKESHGSSVSQDKEVTVGMGNHSELQAGYDSQFEDGELRESDVQCWEEAEQVDYDTEFEEERSFALEAESGEQELKVERGSSPEVTGNFKYCEMGEALRENSVSLKMRTVEVPDGETKKIDCLDGSNYDLRVDLSKVSKRELLSCVEGSLSSDVVQRSRTDNFDGSYPRAEREAGSDKFMGRDRSASHMRGRSPGGGHFFNPPANYWDSKRQHAHIYHGPYNFGRPRPKSIVGSRGYPMGTDQATSEAAGVARPDNRITRQFMGSYRPLIRRRSPIERDDSYGMHPRMPTVRDTSPDRNRFRRYPQGVSRGIRDEYLRHIPDDSTKYLNRMPHRLDRRERSISLHEGRPHYTVPYKRTRSRSRSRSPTGWLLQRDRNEGSRRHSRSPDFRSDVRIDRVRLPFTKRFAAGYGEFISPPQSRISPRRNPRMCEDRNPGLDHFRGRKSPVRMIRQSQRFDQVRPIRRFNSDDYFRPMVGPRRFSDMAAGGKGCKYEGSDDDKHGSRYGMIHRVRCYDTDGAVRRFREESYVAKNSLTVTNAIGVSSRRPDDADAPRTASEDRSIKMQQ